MTPELYEAVAKIARHCWRGVHWEKGPNGPRPVREPLKRQHLERHIDGGPGVGLAPITPGESTTRVAVLDFDSHKGDVPWETMRAKARAVSEHLAAHKVSAIPFRSSGGKGIHLIMLWDEVQDAYSVRQLLATALSSCGLRPGTKGVKHDEVEVFPKQDDVPADGLGNMFILPLTGESLPLDPGTLELRTYDYAESVREWPKSKAVPQLTRPSTTEHPSSTIASPSSATNLADVQSALQAIPNEGAESLDYDSWRDVIFAIHHATDGSAEGLALAHEFSKRSTKYDADFLEERVWPYIRSERGGKVITAATLFNKARAHGWQEDIVNEFTDLGPLEQDLPPIRELEGKAPADGKAERFAIVPIHVYATRPSPEWIVYGVLPQAELALIIGESGAGKSFFAWDLSAAIAQGVRWRTRRVKKGRVLYIVAEGQTFFHQRAVAYGKRHDVSLESLQIGVISDTPNLMQKDDVKSICEQLIKFGKVDVIVVDTFAQVTPGANENAAEDMGRALANCKALHRATGALIVLVHHIGKDETKGARGWSGIKAAADAEITIARRDPLRIATVSKMKDGADGVVLPFKLVDVELGQNAEGERISSCIVEHIEDEQEKASGRTPAGDVAKHVWQTARGLALLDGEETTVGSVIEEAIKEMVTDPTKRDRRREVVTRALQTLTSGGWLRVEGGRVLLPMVQ